MSKIVFANLNVGSAIEQSGNQFILWTKEIENDIEIFKEQTSDEVFFNFLIKHSPNLIIINSFYPRILTPTFYYKLLNPTVKIILISRVFTDFWLNLDYNETINIFEHYNNMRFLKLYQFSNTIVSINSCGYIDRIPKELQHKTIDCCGTNNPDMFYIDQLWENRKKKFILLGSLDDRKIHIEFLKKIKKLNITIDAYGQTVNQTSEFKKEFMNCSNINYKGILDQYDVPNVLNEYKYYILPHCQYEPLCNSLHQAILCGCIPIVLDDHQKGMDNREWLDFAKGMIFSCDDLTSYINSLETLNQQDVPDGEKLSKLNRQQYLNKYPSIENKFKDAVKKLL